MRRLITTALAVMFVLTACGEDPKTINNVAQAANLAQEEGTVWASSIIETEIGAEAGGGVMTVEGLSSFDLEKDVGHMTATLSAEGGTSGAPDAGMGRMESVYDLRDGFVVYMKWPFMTDQIPNSKEWIKFDMQELGEQQGFDFNSLMQGQGDPTQGLEYLRGADNVEEVGKEDVRDVETTHYRGTITLDSVAEQMPDAAESIERLKELSGIEEIPMEAWLDAEGLARRVRYVYDYNPPADAPVGTPTGNMTMTMEFFDYGKPVSVEFPPESNVTDLAELMGGS